MCHPGEWVHSAPLTTLATDHSARVTLDLLALAINVQCLSRLPVMMANPFLVASLPGPGNLRVDSRARSHGCVHCLPYLVLLGSV